MSMSTSLEYGKSIQRNIIRMRQNYIDNQDKLLSEKKVRQKRGCVQKKRIYEYTLIQSENISRKIQVKQGVFASEKEEKKIEGGGILIFIYSMLFL